MSTGGVTYAGTGVNLSAAEQATDLIKPLARSTHGPEVPVGIGLFGGLFDATSLRTMDHPLLVASLDGVGTKTALVARAGQDSWRSLGQDIVHHCVNDVAVQGARPLFFLDYLAVDKLIPAEAAAIVAGMADACRAVGCALIGGETAEMPLLYAPGAHDIAGCMVGVVERTQLIDGSAIRSGDVVLGLPSSGLHTNGYSLALRLIDNVPPQAHVLLGRPLLDALLEPHRCYWTEIQAAMRAVPVHGFAHITGGGIAGNLVRILPDDCAAIIDAAAWETPPLFRLLAQAGHIAQDEMFRVFNMGIGLAIVVPGDAVATTRQALPQTCVIGRITPAGAAGRHVVIEGGV